MTNENFNELTAKIISRDKTAEQTLYDEAFTPVYERAKSYFSNGKLSNIRENELEYRAERVLTNMINKYKNLGEFPKTYSEFVSICKAKMSRKLYNIHVKRIHVLVRKPRKKGYTRGQTYSKKQDLNFNWLKDQEQLENFVVKPVDENGYEKQGNESYSAMLKQEMMEFLKSADEKTQTIISRYYGLGQDVGRVYDISKDFNITRARVYQIISKVNHNFIEYLKENHPEEFTWGDTELS